MIFRLGGLWLAGISCAVTLGACVGASSEVGSMNDGGGGGGPECEAGDTRPAGDGCNTCTCDDDGSWECTLLGCGVCEDGATRPAEDGCNDCVCTGGEWACTLRDCQTCTVGDTREDDCGSCWCADNGNGPTWNCTANYCPPECEAGETKPADDECNTCTCTAEGTWGCTELACPECTDGDTRPAGDDCNTCSCMNGTWGCTLKFCGQPACDAGLGDCDGDPANGCESPVGEGGCADRCEPADPALVPVAAGASCECPEGMACVRSDLENRDVCLPIAQGCTNGVASCLCMADCACDEGSTCSDEMSLGGVIISCDTTP